MIDIIHAFEAEYSERVLITGFLNPRNKPLDSRVKVELITAYDRSSGLKRFLTWFLGALKAFWLIKTKYRNADLFLVSNPPFVALIPLLCTNQFKILIYDIYPDAFVEFGFLKESSFLVKAWKCANRKVFSKAAKVFTLTEGMKTKLSAYVSADRITIVPIWSNNNFFKPVLKEENIFLKEINCEEKFLVLYSGNLGKSHPVELLVEWAKLCKEPEIHFLIIGGGDKFELIQSLIERSGLKNIQLLPWQPTERLPFTLASADLAVVTLGDEAADLSIPSKTFDLMSIGVPILGISPKNSALSHLICSEKIGKNFQSSKSEEILSFIYSIFKDEAMKKHFSQNSLTTSKKYGAENAQLFL